MTEEEKKPTGFEDIKLPTTDEGEKVEIVPIEIEGEDPNLENQEEIRPEPSNSDSL